MPPCTRCHAPCRCYAPPLSARHTSTKSSMVALNSCQGSGQYSTDAQQGAEGGCKAGYRDEMEGSDKEREDDRGARTERTGTLAGAPACSIPEDSHQSLARIPPPLPSRSRWCLGSSIEPGGDRERPAGAGCSRGGCFGTQDAFFAPAFMCIPPCHYPSCDDANMPTCGGVPTFFFILHPIRVGFVCHRSGLGLWLGSHHSSPQSTPPASAQECACTTARDLHLRGHVTGFENTRCHEV